MGRNKRRKDWGMSPQQVVDHMQSGGFKRDSQEKREKASITKLFHLIRKLDKHMGDERHIFYDKYAFKKLLEKGGIKVPETYATLRKEGEWETFWNKCSEYDTFVLKPNRLSEGRGIHVLVKGEEYWQEINGDNVAVETLKKDSIGFLRRKTTAHRDGQRVKNIMMAEERVFSHEDFSPYTVFDGIVDFRMYLVDDKVLYGKMRCPTKKSKGLGNTSKSAIALFVRDGIIHDGREVFKNTSNKYNGVDVTGQEVPHWDTVVKCCEDVAKLFDSPFHSVDLTVNKEGEPIVMECEKIPTLGHFKKEEAKRLHDELTVWAQEKLWRK